MSDLMCPACGEYMRGGEFGDDAFCDNCKKGFKTDWDYLDFDMIDCWVIEETHYKENNK